MTLARMTRVWNAWTSIMSFLRKLTLRCIGLITVMLLAAGVARAEDTGYHYTAVSGPATDADGAYTIDMFAIAYDYAAHGDVIQDWFLDTRLNGSGSWSPVTHFFDVFLDYSNPEDRAVNITGQGNGTHNYRMLSIIYSPVLGGYIALEDYHDVVVSIPSSNNGITTPPTEVKSGLAVGTTPYGMDVGGNGDAVVSVPLQLTPGVAGFEPSLSLIYTSGRALDRAERSLPEDTIGYGWRLSGLSSIRRCVVGQASGNAIALNGNDSLCLDGMPLVRTGGTHLAVGATYRTQIESYQKIEIKGASGSLWFEVTTTDGSVLQYGNGGGSRVDKGGGIDYQWSINRATDVHGNVIDYSYHHDDTKGINYPLSIDYDGASVEFEYQTRSDAAAVNIGSAAQTQSVFLHTVRVTTQNTAGTSTLTTREYRLLNTVDGNGNRRLNKLQQCGYSTSGTFESCLAPLDFDWISNTTIAGVDILLDAVTDGLGAYHVFQYTTLTAGSGAGLFTGRPSEFGSASAPADTEALDENSSGALRHVVTKIRRDNGLGGYHDTNYRYLGYGLKSTKNWGFLGFFAQRITDVQSGIVTYVQYRMDYPYFGSVSRIHQYDATHGSHTQTLTKTESAFANHTESYTGGTTYYPYASRNTSYILEGASQLGVSEVESVFSFDTPGYITQVVSTANTGTGSSTSGGTGVWGEVPNHTVSGVLSTVTNTVKFTNNTSSWLIGFVNEATTSSSGGSTVGSILQKTTFTQHTGSLNVKDFTRFPGDANLNLKTTYTYDSSGHVTNTDITGANVTSRSTSTDSNNFIADRYPGNFIQHFPSSANDLETTIDICDLRFGSFTCVTDANSQQRHHYRDAYGRTTSLQNEHGVVTTTSYVATTAVTVGSAESAYKIETNSPVSPMTRTWYDKLGRVIRTEHQTFGGTFSRVDTWYDTQGRVEKTSLPYFSGTIQYVTPTYDLRGRVTNVSRPDGSSTSSSYTVSGNNVIVTVTDNIKTSTGGSAGTQVKRSEFNILGQLVSTTDAYGTGDAATVTYVYDANGNATTVTAPGSAISTMEYDAAGNRTKLIGPDVGTIITTYNALGQVRTNKDAKNQTTTFTYDTLGRLTAKSNTNGESANWVWDTATNGKGKLKSKTNNSGFTETYNYNSDSQLSSVVTNITAIGGSTGTYFYTYHTYDSSGRPLATTYPGGSIAVTRTYNSYGYLSQLKRGSQVLQTWNATDAFGNATQETYGNGVVTYRTYDPKTGQLTDIDTSKSSTTIQNLDYAWRSNGTLESRINTVGSEVRKETFGYDALNRLKLAETFINSSNTRDLNYQYNSLGNILSKTSTLSGDLDVTSYSYGAGAAGPHAVTSAKIGGVSHTLTYDANGAITKYDKAGTSTEDKYLQYNASNQPTKIVVGSSLTDTNPLAKDEFAYGPDGQRYARKTTWKEGSTTKQEHVSYIGNTEYITYVGDPTMLATYKTRIGDNIMHIRTIAPNPYYDPYSYQYPYDQPILEADSLEFAHRDHLGGVESVTNQYGQKLQQLAYEPFGSRKDSDWRRNIDSTELSNLLMNYVIFDYSSFPYLYPYEPVPVNAHHARVARGFTGHEHLDRTGFIHMNGRVYDPQLGRFLSPDPIVQAPTNSQSWNRYTYVFNNPLAFTDPSGFITYDGGLGDYVDYPIQDCMPGLIAVYLGPGVYVCMSDGSDVGQGNSYFDWPESDDPWDDNTWDYGYPYGGGVFVPSRPPSTTDTPVTAQPSGSASDGRHYSDDWVALQLKHNDTEFVWGATIAAAGAAAAADGPLPIGDVVGLGILIAGAMADSKVRSIRPRATFYHGSDPKSLNSLLSGEILKSTIANKNKIDGPPGFYLADNPIAAEYFSVRRGGHYLLRFDITYEGVGTLINSGAKLGPIPVGKVNLPGNQLYIPLSSFGVFNGLLGSGDIIITAVPFPD